MNRYIKYLLITIVILIGIIVATKTMKINFFTKTLKAQTTNQQTTLDTKALIEELNKNFADEWFAYYQYWLGAKVAQGPILKQVVEELDEHAEDEKRHAKMLAERIIELGGKPIMSPEEWYKVTFCGYVAPTDPRVAILLKQNITAERCAINAYKKLSEMVKGKDPKTYKISEEILKDEIEHELDLLKLQKKIK